MIFGAVSLADIQEEVRKEILEVPAGKLSPLQKEGKNLRFYYVKERKNEDAVALEHVREQIRGKLLERKISQQMDVYVQDLRRTAHVEIRL